MGFFSDLVRIEYKGHVIEVKAGAVTFFPVTMYKYTLFVDGRKRDSDITDAFSGTTVETDLGEVPIVVRVKVGLISNKYFLEVGGWSRQMDKIK